MSKNSENEGTAGRKVPLSIKSDAVVCHKSVATNPHRAFLQAAYHTELKEALKRKNIAMRCKSELLAESLAKSLEPVVQNGEFPNVI